MTVTLNGPITKANVGPGGYAVGIGYDPGDGEVEMVGYMLTPGGKYTEGTNIQDESHLVQTASPSSSDRYTRYPQVTQGDWSQGGKQLVFTNPSQFYESFGFDTSAPGLLQTLPSPQTIVNSIGTPSTFPSFPVGTDGNNWIVGRYDSVGGSNCYIGNDGTPLGTPQSIGNGNNPEIYALLRAPLGVFAATSAGIYLVNFTTPNSSTLWSVDVVPNTTTYNVMAYFPGASGGLYYIKASDGNLHYVTSAGGSINAGPTHPAMEQNIASVSSFAGGILYVCGVSVQGGVNPTYLSTVYTFNGATSTFIEAIQGSVKATVEMNGAVYLLMIEDQPEGNGNYTLLQFSNGTLTIVADTRYDAPDFQESLLILPIDASAKSTLTTDGRYLYIGHQGLPGLKFDPYGTPPAATGSQTGNFTHYVGAAAPTDTHQSSRSLLKTAGSDIIDVYANKTHSILQVSAFRAPSTTGSLITSYFDFGIPTINKLFQSLNIEFTAPQDPQSLTVQYRTDDNQIFANCVVINGPTNIIRAVLPVNTIGSRIQFQISYDSTFFTSAAWTVRFYTAHAQLARIWEMSLGCRNYEQTYNGIPDPQRYSGAQLWANLLNAKRQTDGNVYLFVSDPTDPDGDGSYVDVVQAHIEDMTAITSAGKNPAPRQDMDTGFDMERDVDIQLVEDLTATDLL